MSQDPHYCLIIFTCLFYHTISETVYYGTVTTDEKCLNTTAKLQQLPGNTTETKGRCADIIMNNGEDQRDCCACWTVSDIPLVLKGSTFPSDLVGFDCTYEISLAGSRSLTCSWEPSDPDGATAFALQSSNVDTFEEVSLVTTVCSPECKTWPWNVVNVFPDDPRVYFCVVTLTKACQPRYSCQWVKLAKFYRPAQPPNQDAASYTEPGCIKVSANIPFGAPANSDGLYESYVTVVPSSSVWPKSPYATGMLSDFAYQYMLLWPNLVQTFCKLHPYGEYDLTVKYRLKLSQKWSSTFAWSKVRAASGYTTAFPMSGIVYVKDRGMVVNPYFSKFLSESFDVKLRLKINHEDSIAMTNFGFVELNNASSVANISVQFDDSTMGLEPTTVSLNHDFNLNSQHKYSHLFAFMNTADTGGLLMCWNVLPDYSSKLAYCEHDWDECLLPRIVSATCLDGINVICDFQQTSNSVIKANFEMGNETSMFTTPPLVFFVSENGMYCGKTRAPLPKSMFYKDWVMSVNYCHGHKCGATETMMLKKCNSSIVDVSQSLASGNDETLCLRFNRTCNDFVAYNVMILNTTTSNLHEGRNVTLQLSTTPEDHCAIGTYFVSCAAFSENDTFFIHTYWPPELEIKSHVLESICHKTPSTKSSSTSIPITGDPSSVAATTATGTKKEKTTPTSKSPLPKTKQPTLTRTTIIGLITAGTVFIVSIFAAAICFGCFYRRLKVRNKIETDGITSLGANQYAQTYSGEINNVFRSSSSAFSVSSGVYEEINDNYAYPTLYDIPNKHLGDYVGTGLPMHISCEEDIQVDDVCASTSDPDEVNEEWQPSNTAWMINSPVATQPTSSFPWDVLGPTSLLDFDGDNEYVKQETAATTSIHDDSSKDCWDQHDGHNGYTPAQIVRTFIDC